MQVGDIIAAIELGTSGTAYTYTAVGREHIWLGMPDSQGDGSNVSCIRGAVGFFTWRQANSKIHLENEAPQSG